MASSSAFAAAIASRTVRVALATVVVGNVRRGVPASSTNGTRWGAAGRPTSGRVDEVDVTRGDGADTGAGIGVETLSQVAVGEADADAGGEGFEGVESAGLGGSS